MISYVLFDLDDTLCDSTSARRAVLDEIAGEYEKQGIDPDTFLSSFHRVERALMKQFLAGEIGRDAYRERRFGDTLEGLGLDRGSSLELNERFMVRNNFGCELFDDVRPTLRQLAERGVRAVIATNGPGKTQRQKVRRLGIEGELDHVFVSEYLGVSKPDPEYFRLVLDQLGTPPGQVVFVGDSIESDAPGAKALNIPFFLLDRTNRATSYDGPRIRSLLELIPIIDARRGSGVEAEQARQ